MRLKPVRFQAQHPGGRTLNNELCLIMKRPLLRISILALAATVTAGTAFAQNTPATTSPTPGTTPRSAVIPPANAPASSPNQSINPVATTTQTGSGPLMASRAIGATVKSTTGETIGQMEDLLVDQNGQLKMAVLGVGGFLGIGQKKTPVPWQAITMGPDREFTLNIDRQKLKNAPTIDKNQTAADWATPNFVTEVYAHYGLQDNSAAGATGSGVGTETGRQIRNDARDLKEDLKQKTRDLKDDLQRGTEKTKDRLTNP